MCTKRSFSISKCSPLDDSEAIVIAPVSEELGVLFYPRGQFNS